MDYLTILPVDILLQLLTYLNFQDIIKVCTLNSKLYSYCINPRYNNKWKFMIDNIYCSVYNYEDKLKKIWSKLHLADGTYNYQVYTQLIFLLDPLTQLIIYYQQGDIKSFNYNSERQFLTMFLLNKPEEMKKYKPNIDINSYYLLLQEKMPAINNLNRLLFDMSVNGNIKGVKYMLEKGADIHANYDIALRYASEKGHLDVVKYLVEHGADIHAEYDGALRYASEKGHLDVVKYLAEHGADIHAQNDDALKWASTKGHIDVVKYLVEQGANINVDNDYALRKASEEGHLDVVKYLVEHGADIHFHELALRWASQNGHIDVVKYLVKQGADIHVYNDDALKGASRNGHLDVVKYLSSADNTALIVSKRRRI